MCPFLSQSFSFPGLRPNGRLSESDVICTYAFVHPAYQEGGLKYLRIFNIGSITSYKAPDVISLIVRSSITLDYILSYCDTCTSRLWRQGPSGHSPSSDTAHFIHRTVPCMYYVCARIRVMCAMEIKYLSIVLTPVLLFPVLRVHA